MKSCRLLSFGLGLSFVFILAACGLAACAEGQSENAQASAGPISISIAQPVYGFNVLPGSVRRIFATVANGATVTNDKNNLVTWSVIGST
jgi:hypothetical protein